MLDVRMLNLKVLIKPIPSEKTEGGILLLGSSYERPQTGIVEAIDPDIEDLFVKEGDVVMYPKGNGRPVIYNGTTYLVVSASNLLATVPPTRKINHQYILVLIDKTLQKLKKEKLTEITTDNGDVKTLFRAPQFLYMTSNLQVGPVVQIGKKALEEFPEMEVGDLLIFHHTIEEDKWRLLERDPDGNELRLIDGSNANRNFEIMGIIQDDGSVYPTERFIFLEPMVQKFNPATTKADLAIYEDMPEQLLRDKIEQLDMELQKLRMNLDNPELKFKKGTDPTTAQMKKAEEIMKAMDSLQQEKANITKHLNSRKLVTARVLHVNPKTSEELAINSNDVLLCEKDILYPLDIMGSQFLLLHNTEVIAKITHEE